MGDTKTTGAKSAARSKKTESAGVKAGGDGSKSSRAQPKSSGAPASAARAKSSAAITKPRAAPPKKEHGAQAKLIERSVADKQARLAAEGRVDIELIKRRRQRIAEDFYDIGEALARLKRPGVAQALGHASFPDLCEAELGMSSAKASYLIAIVTHVPRAEATKLGQDRTVALLQLAEATPETDTAVDLAKGVLTLPGGEQLHIARASAQQIRDAAKVLRARGQKSGTSPKARRGRSASPEEREVASKLQARLRSLGADHATVTAVATKPGQPSVLRIDRVPIDKLALLKKAL